MLVGASPFHTFVTQTPADGHPGTRVGLATNEDPHPVCPCGGDLEVADMLTHRAALPVSANDPADEARLARQRAAEAEAKAKKKAAEEAARPPTLPIAP